MSSRDIRKAQHPDHLGMLYMKERAKRRLSHLIEGSSGKKDVTGGSTLRRRLSATLDGAPKVVKYYFELSGHLLKWWEEFGPGREEKGQVSLLSCSGVRDLDRDERAILPSGTKGGFCLLDAASDLHARRGDIFLFSENLQDLKDWLAALRKAFTKFHVSPMAGLGPVQAANEKPILEGELLVRDTLDGVLQTTWTPMRVSLFDNRVECRRIFVSDIAPSPVISTARRKSISQAIGLSEPSIGAFSSAGVPPCRVDRFTINFYVGDSRVRPHAFLLSDFIITLYFAAKDDLEKLFWMQTMAKAMRNLVAMHEHAFAVRQALQSDKKGAENEAREDDDDDDDEEEIDYAKEDDKDARRPPQVRRESMRLFYGKGAPPPDELSEPPLARRMSRARPPSGEQPSDTEEEDMPQGSSLKIKIDEAKPVLATPIEKRLSLKVSFPQISTATKSSSSPMPLQSTTLPLNVKPGFPALQGKPSTPGTGVSQGKTSLASTNSAVEKSKPLSPVPAVVTTKPIAQPTSAGSMENKMATSPATENHVNGSAGTDGRTKDKDPSVASEENSAKTPVTTGGRGSLAQSLSKMGATGSGLLNPRNLKIAKKKDEVETTPGKGTLTVFSPLDSVSTSWIQAEFDRLVSMAKMLDVKSGSSGVARVSFGQLLSEWGSEHSDDLSGLLLRAKRHGLAKYEGDMLFADYDDTVQIEVKTK